MLSRVDSIVDLSRNSVVSSTKGSVESVEAENQHLRDRIAALEGELAAARLGPFHASRIGRHFHRPHRAWAHEIAPWNFIVLDTHEQAVASGLRACKTCCS